MLMVWLLWLLRPLFYVELLGQSNERLQATFLAFLHSTPPLQQQQSQGPQQKKRQYCITVAAAAAQFFGQP